MLSVARPLGVITNCDLILVSLRSSLISFAKYASVICHHLHNLNDLENHKNDYIKIIYIYIPSVGISAGRQRKLYECNSKIYISQPGYFINR